jgi:hypothetical protein
MRTRYRPRALFTTALLAGILALDMVSPPGARAKLCLSETATSAIFTLPKLTPKRGAVRSAIGYRTDSAGAAASPASAHAVINAAGIILDVWIQVAPQYLAAGSSSDFNTPPTTYIASIGLTTGKVAVGDTGGGFSNGASAQFTVIDCTTVPAIP